jgi:cell division topological specificity factor
MTLLDFFRRQKKPAEIARERLSVIVARERGSRGGPDYLPQLKQELLAVLAKYEKINLDNVSVKVAEGGDYDVLELNIVLPEEAPPSPGPARGAKPLGQGLSGRQ